jgi:hypothetical protein
MEVSWVKVFKNDVNIPRDPVSFVSREVSTAVSAQPGSSLTENGDDSAKLIVKMMATQAWMRGNP